MILNIKIFFPPQFEPFQPYLAPYYLKGLLNKYSINSSIFDLNVEFYLWLLKKRGRGKSKNRELKFLDDNVDKARIHLREKSVDLIKYRNAINILERYFNRIAEIDFKLGLTYLKISGRYSLANNIAFSKKDSLLSRFLKNHLSKIRFSDSDVVFITLVVIDQLPASLIIADFIKSNYPNVKIYVGGPLVSRLERRFNKDEKLKKYFDGIYSGDAYISLPHILGSNEIFSEHVKPDFSDCQFEKYLSVQSVLPYLIAHGCKWGKCDFCSHHLSYSGYRESPIENVLDDLEELTKNQKISVISFSDEYLTPTQLKQLAEGLINRNIKIAWLTFVRPEREFADVNFTELLYKAGCRILMFGFETASQRTLKKMKKGSNTKYFEDILRSCKKSNIACRIDFMLGYPSEDVSDISKTYSFIKKNKELLDTPFSSYSTAIFELRENTPVFNELEARNIIIKDKLRGDLDDVYDFISPASIDEKEKLEWRGKFISIFKDTFDNEVITPMNKTHQLIYKNLFDKNLVQLPPVNIKNLSWSGAKIKFSNGVNIFNKIVSIKIENYSTGGIIEVKKELGSLIDAIDNNFTLEKVFEKQDVLNEEHFTELLEFLYRSDYVSIYN